MILLRSLLFNAVMYVTAVGFSLYGQALRVLAPRRVVSAGVLWARVTLAALRVFCRIRVEVIGAEFLPRAGGALVAAQHQSAFDTLVWLTLLPRPAYVLKLELTRLPLFGGLLRPSGFIAVDRAGGALALRKMMADARAAVAAGRQVVIFPEGTRVAPGERGVMQPGVVALAAALRLPVVPAATNSGLFWGRSAFRKYPGVLRVRIFPPIPGSLSRADMLDALAAAFYDEGVTTADGAVVSGTAD